jgi:hypothetical protein
MTIGEKISLLGIAIGVITSIILVIRKKFFTGARLHIELTIKSLVDGPKGISPKNDFSNGPIDTEKALTIFETKWKYEFKIHNISQHTAYNLELYSMESVFKYIELKKLSEFKIVKPDTSDSIKGEIITQYETIPTERAKNRKKASELENLKMIITYRNASNSLFYNTFQFKTQKNFNKRSKFIFRKKGTL